MKFRNIEDSFDEALRTYPVLALTGPRQSGKTTFLEEQLDGFRYVSLEDPDIKEQVLNNPRGFIEEYDNKVILDEVQHVPELFSYIQSKVDKDKVMGQYILSGSQNFNLMANITQSLAGRVSLHRLMPFDLKEMKKACWLSDDLNEVMTSGFYPAIFQRGIKPDLFYANYIDTYIKRDVSQLRKIQDHITFKRFLQLLAVHAGQLLNYNNISKAIGISHTTVREWITVLETSYIVYTLSPYYKNFKKRIVKSPKLYFYDTGILCHLLGIRKGRLNLLHPMYGAIFENLVVSEHHKQNYHDAKLRDYYFWQDSNGNEIDLLYNENAETFLTEIKSTQTIRQKLFSNLLKFEKVSTDPIALKTLLYGGNKDQSRNDIKIQSWLNIS